MPWVCAFGRVFLDDLGIRVGGVVHVLRGDRAASGRGDGLPGAQAIGGVGVGQGRVRGDGLDQAVGVVVAGRRNPRGKVDQTQG